MPVTPWAPGLVLPQGENDILDYTLGFARWFADDAIATASAEGTGLTVDVVETLSPNVKVRVSAAAANSSMTLRITTASGQRADFTTYFNPQRATCCA